MGKVFGIDKVPVIIEAKTKTKTTFPKRVLIGTSLVHYLEEPINPLKVLYIRFGAVISARSLRLA